MSAVALFVAACTSNSDLDDLQGQIDELKSTQIATIGQQIAGINGSLSSLEATDKELKGAISSLQKTADDLQKRIDTAKEKTDNLEAELTQVSATIESLQAQDLLLEQKIEDLKKYVDDELKNTKDWVNATFSTLEHYEGLLSSIAGIKADIAKVKEELEAAYTEAIAAAISKSEASMQEWVNVRLTGYYTVAQTDAKLDVLERAIANGDDSVLATLRGELVSAKGEIAAAYGKAISEAISEYDGVVNKKIADDIKTATDALEAKMDALSERMDALEERVAALELTVGKLIDMVQSVVVVPDYSDGSVILSSTTDNKLRFEVYPLTAAEALVQAGPSNFSLDYVETLTRSSEQFVNLPVTEVSFTGKTLLLTVDGTGLPASVLEGASSVCARLKISDGTITRSSEFFPICRKAPEPVVTGGSEDIHEDSALLYGWCTFEVEEGKKIFYGIEFSDLDLTDEPHRVWAEKRESDGRFCCSIDGLHSNTLYYYRAFAVHNGTRTYGEVRTFTTVDFQATVITGEATDIGLYTATLNGILQVDSENELRAETGFLFSYSVSDLESLKAEGEKTTGKLSEDGSFSSSQFGYGIGRDGPALLYCNTIFYYVAYAKILDKVFYGKVKSFRTQDIMATVTTGEPANVESFTATLRGAITIENKEDDLPQDVWFLHSDSASDLESLKTKGHSAIGELNEDGSFSCDIGPLLFNKTYYVVACARVHDMRYYDASKTFYGEVISFITPKAKVTTGVATDIGLHEAVLNGQLDPFFEDYYSSLNAGFLISESVSDLESLKAEGRKVPAMFKGDIDEHRDGSFYMHCGGMSSNKTYYYVAWATEEDETFYGEVQSFSTFGASITSAKVTGLRPCSVTLNATTQSLNPASAVTIGFLYSDRSSTLEALKTNHIAEQKGSTVDISGLTQNTLYYYVPFAEATDTNKSEREYGSVQSFTTPNLPDGAVDLGFGPLWATCNLTETGFASAPEEYGDYYAWGETEPKSDYSWGTYKWCNGTSETLTKYNTLEDSGTVDGKTVLEPEDDAAHVKLGGNWRMPTRAECASLYSAVNCTWTWTTENGVDGCKVTSRKNGNSIFLPAAGCRNVKEIRNVGTLGYYWTSSFNEEMPIRTYFMRIESTSFKCSHYERTQGYSIRPVADLSE